MFDLSSALKLLPVVGSAVAALPEFKKIWDGVVSTFSEDDQVVLKSAYEDIMADNDAGHERLQNKLAEAAARE